MLLPFLVRASLILAAVLAWPSFSFASIISLDGLESEIEVAGMTELTFDIPSEERKEGDTDVRKACDPAPGSLAGDSLASSVDSAAAGWFEASWMLQPVLVARLSCPWVNIRPVPPAFELLRPPQSAPC